MVLLVASAAGAGLVADQGVPTVLSEGAVLQGVDGKLVGPDANDTWHFELIADANTAGTRLAAGARFELLPSAVLENLIADANDRLEPEYRLMATVTQFRKLNFLFPSYYLPLSKLKGADPTGANEPVLPDEIRLAMEKSSTELAIPPEVLETLRSRRAPRAVPRAEGGRSNGTAPRKTFGHVMVDRVGVISAYENRPVFIPYALGLNVSEEYYELLPCRTLELALQRQAVAPEAIRFNVAGLVTEFKGRKLLLLQRAIRVYSHGNFSP
jgi:hypothetical protein